MVQDLASLLWPLGSGLKGLAVVSDLGTLISEDSLVCTSLWHSIKLDDIKDTCTSGTYGHLWVLMGTYGHSGISKNPEHLGDP